LAPTWYGMMVSSAVMNRHGITWVNADVLDVCIFIFYS